MAALLDVVKKGSTDRSVTLRIIDSGDGTPETGVVYNTSGIDLWYRREGAAKVSITEATLSALTDAHADGGFLHIGDGEYRLDLPDAAFAAGANHVDIGGTVTGMIVIGGRVRLVNYDPEDAVRMGLTALPNANAEAAGGLYTRGTGAGQINQDANGRIDAHLNNAAHGGAAAVLTLERLVATSVTSNQAAVKLQGNGSAPGLEIIGGVTGPGLTSTAGAFANAGGAILTGIGSGPGLGLLPGSTGHGLYALSGSSSGDAIRGEKVGSGNAFNLVGSVTVAVETFLNNLVNRLGAFTGTGTNTVLGFFLALFKKDVAAPSDVGGTFDPATDSVEAIRDNMSTPPSAASIADAVWDEARSGHVTSGTFGEGVKAESLNGQAQADVEAIVDGIVQDYRLHELLSAVLSGAPLAGSLFGDLTEDDGGTQRFTTNALENAPSGGGGGGATAADIWAYATRTLTQGAASVIAAVTGSSITVYRGTTWSISLTGLGNIATYDIIYLSVKVSEDDSDNNAILRVKNAVSGLLRLNKAAPTAASNGTITVDNATSGNITITVNEAETQNEPLGQYVYDVKGVDSDGSVVMLSAGGQFNIRGDITRTIS